MPVTPDKPAPYAPASAILSLIERHRDKRLPSPIDADVLARSQVSESLVPRTLQALQTLDLIDEGGNPTPVFETLRLAPQAEFQQRLRDWLNAAYADALQFVDPTTADSTSIHDAFRGYNPAGQRDRMVTLFTSLFKAAGVGDQSAPASPRKMHGAAKVLVKGGKATVRPQRKASPLPTPRPIPGSSELHPALVGILTSLPAPGTSWTKTQRDLFLKAFGSILDLAYPPVDDTAADIPDSLRG